MPGSPASNIRLDDLIGHFVDQARRSGASWTDIGRSMGVTKQAARKRFVPKGPGEANDLDASQGFERFTPRARNVVMAAHEAAVGLAALDYAAHAATKQRTRAHALTALRGAIDAELLVDSL